MDSLPKEIMKHNVAAYLTMSDMCQLSGMSKRWHSKLSLSTTPPRKILTEFSRIDCRNGNASYGPYLMDYGFEIPVPSQSQVDTHSVRVSMSWKDQGWGRGVRERKSYFFIMSSDKESGERLGPVVFASGLASHSKKRLSFTFTPKRQQSYHLWYVAGGGSGHSLNLFDVSVQALVFDDPSHSYLKAWNFIALRNVFRPWDVATSLAAPHQPVPRIMNSFFWYSGVAERELSPRFVAFVKLVKSLLDDYAREVYLYDKNSLCGFEDFRYQYQSTPKAALNENGCGSYKKSVGENDEGMGIDCDPWSLEDDEEFDPKCFKW